MAAWHAATLHCCQSHRCQTTFSYVPPCAALLAESEFCSPKSWYFPSSLQFFQVLSSTSQVVCHLPPTAICHRPKLRSRFQSRRKKCGFDETQFPKFIPNSLTLATGTLVIAVYSPKPVDQFQSDALKLENVFS